MSCEVVNTFHKEPPPPLPRGSKYPQLFNLKDISVNNIPRIKETTENIVSWYSAVIGQNNAVLLNEYKKPKWKFGLHRNNSIECLTYLCII